MSAVILHNTLLNAGIIGSQGNTYFELNGIRTNVHDNSVVGNIIQEWLADFMTCHAISYQVPANTQEFPDYLMTPSNGDHGLLEIKCFTKSPNFDIANFHAYCRSLTQNPKRLDSHYLIFEYEALNGNIVIKNLWLEKVWKITCGSSRSRVKIQWKQNQAVNIRPAIWYSNNTTYPAFSTRKDFVDALNAVLGTSPIGGNWRNNWLRTVQTLYQSQTGVVL